jgi:hypothetical protein
MKNTLLELLKAELVGEHPPVGWYTISELAEKLGVKRGVVQALIARKGWQCKKYRAQTRDGKMTLANHCNVGKL